MKSLFIIAVVSLAVFTGCKKDKETAPAPVKPFDITEHYVAGTLTQKSGSKYTSVFFIQFLEDNKALFINSSASNLTGTYALTADSLIFEVTGGNARTARFALDKDKKITAAYYRALTTEYDASGELLAATQSNELAGKRFKGEEFKMGEVSNRSGLMYNFKAGFPTYGSGIDSATIDNAANSYILIGGSGFKYINGSNVELGFLSNKKLTVFRSSGLFYYGKYNQQ